ncbi:MAG: glycosyltransferase family 4 protein [Bacteroidetes bacterium]|nr:glycosyltransferase family 4 protein [Bacteroidota bacterium]HET6244502.1 glycosyltransferase family 4 protein [Bacteroidia bacterium]
MKIAQIAPLYESIPPKMYGGTERIVYYLTEELIKQGHHVTLFASGDSRTNAELVSICDNSLRLNQQCVDPFAHHIVQLQLVQNRISEFDIVHYHTDYFHFPSSSLNKEVNHVTTVHGRLDIIDLQNVYTVFNGIPLISISNNQRIPIPYANWVGTVYHGLPFNLYKFYPSQGKYLAFLGRISPEKGVERAIEIAKRSGIKLIIAAKISNVDEIYFQTTIKPLLNNELIEFIGEIGEKEKGDFLGNAIALLFPIDWPEPFGIVMIESLACGTPVIGFNKGSVPEILTEGENGFIIDSIEAGVKAITNINSVDRAKCRAIFEEKFSAERMTNDYLKIYEQILKKKVFSNTVNY